MLVHLPIDGVGVGVVVGGRVVTTVPGAALTGTTEHDPSLNTKSSIAISPV